MVFNKLFITITTKQQKKAKHKAAIVDVALFFITVVNINSELHGIGYKQGLRQEKYFMHFRIAQSIICTSIVVSNLQSHLFIIEDLNSY